MVKIKLKDNFGEYKYVFDNKTGQTDFYKNRELNSTTWNPYCEEEFIKKIEESVTISNTYNKCQKLKIIEIKKY